MRFYAPDLTKLKGELEREFDAVVTPTAPTLMYAVASASDLPPAASWMDCQAWVRDIERIAVSNGTDWVRTDTGATIP